MKSLFALENIWYRSKLVMAIENKFSMPIVDVSRVMEMLTTTSAISDAVCYCAKINTFSRIEIY
jgi:hypothetical protein